MKNLVRLRTDLNNAGLTFLQPLRCLIALRNSESRSGCRNVKPALFRSVRRRTRFFISVCRRFVSTPALDEYSFSEARWRSISLSTSERVSPRVVMARMSIRLDIAARLPHWLAISL